MEIAKGEGIVGEGAVIAAFALRQLLLGLEEEVDIDESSFVAIAKNFDLKLEGFDEVVVGLDLEVRASDLSRGGA